MLLSKVRSLLIGAVATSALLVGSSLAVAATANWTPTVAGNYTWATNATPPWDTGVFPNGVDDVANLNLVDTAGTLNIAVSAITLGTLNLGEIGTNGSYTLNNGTITFDVSTGNAIVNKVSGATDSINSFMTWADNVEFNIGSGLQISANGSITETAAGKVMVKNGDGRLLLSGNNAFTGGLLLNNGTVAPNNNGAMNLVTPQVVTFGAGTTTGRFSLQNMAATIGGLVADPATAGSAIVASDNAAARSLNIVINSGTLNYGGTLINGSTGALSFIKLGAGEQVFNGSSGSTATGSMRTNYGTTTLDFANLAGATNLLSSSSQLGLGGGLVKILGSSNVSLASSQTFNDVRTFAGDSRVLVDGNGGLQTTLSTTNGTLNLSFAGPIDFRVASTGRIIVPIANTNGILSGLTTWHGNTFATINTGSGNIVEGLGTYNLTSVEGTTAANYLNKNIDVDVSQTIASGTINPNTLRFSTATSNTLTLATGATINQGAILVSSTTNNAASVITGGTINGHSTRGLMVLQNNPTGTLEIASRIINNGASGIHFVKSGVGTVILSNATNNFTGQVEINNGTLKLGVSGAIPDTSTFLDFPSRLGVFDLNGFSEQIGVLQNDAGGALVTSSVAGSVTLTTAAAGTQNRIYAGVIENGSGTVGLTKAGPTAYQLNLLGTNTYTGVTTVTGGILNLANPTGTTMNGPATIGDGATTAGLDILQLGAANQIADTSVLSFNGTSTNAGTFRMLGFSDTIGGLSSTAGAGIVENSTAAATAVVLTLNPSSNASYSGLIRNGFATANMSLVKTGSAEQTVTGTLSYTGTTNVNNGTYSVLGTHNGGVAYTINSSGTLNVGSVATPGTINIASANNITVDGVMRVSHASSLVLTNGVLGGVGATAPSRFYMENGTVNAQKGIYVGFNSNDALMIQNGGTLRGSLFGGPNNAFGVGQNVGSSGTFNQTGGSVLVPNDWFVAGVAGTGVVNQTGGFIESTIFALGQGSGSIGIFTQNGATANVHATDDIVVGYGGFGELHMIQGTMKTDDWAYVGRVSGGNGTLNMEGGSLNANDNFAIGLDSGATGVVLQSSGVITVEGGQPAYTGNLIVGRNGSGNLSMTGGSIELATPNSTGTINSYSFSLANFGNTNNARDGNLLIGEEAGVGVVDMSNGTINVAANVLLGGYDATFVGGTGTLNLSGGGVIHVGVTSPTGGDMALAVLATSNASVNLSGGLLDVAHGSGKIGAGAGTVSFNFTGGTLRVKEFNSPLLGGNMGGLVQDGPTSLLDVTSNNTTIIGTYDLKDGTVNTGATFTTVVTGSFAADGSGARTAVVTGAGTLNANSGMAIAAGGQLDKTGSGTLRVTGAQANGANSTLNATNGSVILNSNAGSGSSLNLNLSVNGSSATATLNSTQDLKSLSVQNGATVTLSASPGANPTPPPYVPGDKFIRTKSVSVDFANNAKLDLTNGAMIVDYTGNANPTTAIRDALSAGYNFFGWDGTGGITSSLAASDVIASGGSPTTALGFMDNAYFAVFNGLGWASINVGGSDTQFSYDPPMNADHAVPADSVLVKFTYTGDTNLDGITNFDDYINLSNHYELTGPWTWADGDFNYDGEVNFDDYILLVNGYGASDAYGVILSGGRPVAVPEPSSILLLVLGGLGLAWRVRRKGKN